MVFTEIYVSQFLPIHETSKLVRAPKTKFPAQRVHSKRSTINSQGSSLLFILFLKINQCPPKRFFPFFSGKEKKKKYCYVEKDDILMALTSKIQ